MNWSTQLSECKSEDRQCQELSSLGLSLQGQIESYNEMKSSKKQDQLERWIEKSTQLEFQSSKTNCDVKTFKSCLNLKAEIILNNSLLKLEKFGLDSKEFTEAQKQIQNESLNIDSQIQVFQEIQKQNLEVNRLLMVSLLSVIIMISLLQALTKWKRAKKAG